MTAARISQAAAENLVLPSPPARISQAAAEVLIGQPIPVRISQTVLEALVQSSPEPGVYPALPQGIESRRAPATVRDRAAGVDGTTWLWDLDAAIEYRFELVHPAITADQRAALLVFFADNAGNTFTFTWDGDDSTYTAIFDAPPDIRAIAARSGGSPLGTLRFDARVTLRGRAP